MGRLASSYTLAEYPMLFNSMVHFLPKITVKTREFLLGEWEKDYLGVLGSPIAWEGKMDGSKNTYRIPNAVTDACEDRVKSLYGVRQREKLLAIGYYC